MVQQKRKNKTVDRVKVDTISVVVEHRMLNTKKTATKLPPRQGQKEGALADNQVAFLETGNSSSECTGQALCGGRVGADFVGQRWNSLALRCSVLTDELVTRK